MGDESRPDVVPASPSSAGLSSAEALLLRDEYMRGFRSLRDDVANVCNSVAKVSLDQHRTHETLLAIARRLEVAAILHAEVNRRAETHARVTDERLAHLVTASRRDHDTLADVQGKVPDADILPWFRRAWRPALALGIAVIVASALTACATVRMLTPDFDTTDAAHPATAVSYGSP